MTYTVTNLITDAYYSSSVVSRQFETVQGYQLNDGLQWLNEILGDKATDSGDIPYITIQYPLVLVPGQESYFIPNLIDIEAIVFYIGSVRYQMQYMDRARYFGYPRANNINALPLAYTYERQTGGVMLYVYFLPQQAYTVTITGNFFLSNVSLNQDLQSKTCVANLGQPWTALPNPASPLHVSPLLFTLSPGQLVINGLDMAGTYPSVTAMILSINTTHSALPATPQNGAVGSTPVTPYMGAAFVGNDFVLTNTGVLNYGNGAYILLSTTGQVNSLISLTFENFPMWGGVPFQKAFFSVNLDQFYINYLRYSLAARICQELNFDIPPGVAHQLDIYVAKINKMAEPMNLMSQKVSVLSGSKAINYAAINIGQGWTVSSY